MDKKKIFGGILLLLGVIMLAFTVSGAFAGASGGFGGDGERVAKHKVTCSGEIDVRAGVKDGFGEYTCTVDEGSCNGFQLFSVFTDIVCPFCQVLEEEGTLQMVAGGTTVASEAWDSLAFANQDFTITSGCFPKDQSASLRLYTDGVFQTEEVVR